MFYSDQFSVDCPDGYAFITRPKEWSGFEGEYATKKAPIFRVKIDRSLKDQHAILKHISTQLLNLLEINIVLSAQLARCPVNDFILSFTDDVCQLVQQTLSKTPPFNSQGNEFVDICSRYIFLLQKKLKPSFE